MRGELYAMCCSISRQTALAIKRVDKCQVFSQIPNDWKACFVLSSENMDYCSNDGSHDQSRYNRIRVITRTETNDYCVESTACIRRLHQCI